MLAAQMETEDVVENCVQPGSYPPFSPNNTVKIGTVQHAITWVLTVKSLEGYKITDLYRPTFWHPFVGLPNKLILSQAVPKSQTYCSLLPANKQKQFLSVAVRCKYVISIGLDFYFFFKARM